MRKKYLIYGIIFSLLVSFGIANGQNVNFYASQTFGCAPLNVTFTNSSYFDTTYTGHVNYQWSLQGMTTSTSDTTYSETLDAAGYYNIRLEAFDSLWNPLGNYMVDVEVVGSPQKIESSKGFQICPGEETQLYFNTNEQYIYNRTWMFGDGQQAYQNWESHIYNTPGTYMVKLAIDGYCGYDTLEQTIEVDTTAKPVVAAWMDGGDFYCPSDGIHFRTNGPFNQYSWDFGDGNASNLPEPIHSYDSTGVYTVIVTVMNSCGNSSSDTLSVNISNDQPAYADFNFWFEGSDCPGTPVNFQTNVPGTYSWDFGNNVTSTLQKDVTAYMNEGTYTASLTVTNGCGNSATAEQDVIVSYTYETVYDYVSFEFGNTDDPYADTLRICPNQEVNLINQTNNDMLNYTWIFNGSDSVRSRDIVRVFDTAGVYNVYLLAENNCKGMAQSMGRTIVVDPNIQPYAQLNAVPRSVCPGEKVYFFDDDFNGEGMLNTYNIIYGDGAFENGITTITDLDFHTLAQHTYDTLGLYPFEFSVTNQCGNSLVMKDTIYVTDDASKKPFYYVSNTTNPDEGGKMEDWRTRKDPTDIELKIPVQWPSWTNDLNNRIFIYFWYGGVMLADDPGDPNGFIDFSSNNLTAGDTVIAYVPFNQMDYEVGILGGWYCDSLTPGGEEPDNMSAPVNGIALDPGTIVTVAEVVAFNTWNGICKSESINGTWSAPYINGDNIYLDFWYDEQQMTSGFSIWTAPDRMSNGTNWVSDGPYYEMGSDSIQLSPYGGSCTESASYQYLIQGDSLVFPVGTDGCFDRNDMLSNHVFKRVNDDYYYDISGCPGDPIKFSIAGGVSYQWFFGDGNSDTNQIAYHAYADTGKYNAFVVATNACGRNDTMYTEVNIGNTNQPKSEFDIQPYEAMTGEPISFEPYTYYDYDPNMYQWDFGEGTISEQKTPSHIYYEPGDYLVKLTVSNGCGSTNTERWVNIAGETNPCLVDASFYYDIISDTVHFFYTGAGAPSSYTWDFGDQNISNQQNPVHAYGNQGVFNVCLTVSDSANQCNKTYCMELNTGNTECFTDFWYTMDSTGNTVYFMDNSTNVTQWNWFINGDLFSQEPNPVYNFSNSGYYDIMLETFSDSAQCSGKSSQQIFIGSGDTTNCSIFANFYFSVMGDTVFFENASEGGIPDSYSWRFGDNTVSNEANPAHVYYEPGYYNVCLTITDSANQCSNDYCMEVLVGDANCITDFWFEMDSTGNTVYFMDNSTNASQWNWFINGELFSQEPNPVYYFTESGYYDVMLESFSDSTTCSGKFMQQIFIGSKDSTSCQVYANFYYDIIGDTVFFFNASEGSTSPTYSWKFGDQTGSNKKNPIHVYNGPGLYTACLTVYDSTNQCRNDFCIDVFIGDRNCITDFWFDIDETNNTVYFTDKSSDVTQWTWIIDGVALFSHPKPTHTFRKAGYHDVVLKTYSDSTGCSGEVYKQILVGKPDSTNCYVDFTYNVTDMSVEFFSEVSPNITGGFWNFGDGKFGYTENATHTYAKAGEYLVTVNTRDSISGCQVSREKWVTVGKVNCQARFSYFIDSTGVVEFFNESVGNIHTAYWTFGDKTASNMLNPVHVYNSGNTYSVCLTVEDTLSGCSADFCEQLFIPGKEDEIFCKPQISFFVEPGSNTVKFEESSFSGFNKWYWNFGDNTYSNLKNPTHTFNAPGTYTVCLSAVNDQTGCSDDVCIDVTIIDENTSIAQVKAEFGYFVNQINKTVTFRDKSLGNITSRYWTFGDGKMAQDSTTIKHKYSLAKTYEVCLIAVDEENGIKSKACREIKVGEISCDIASDFSFFVDPEDRLISFKDKSLGSVNKWSWYFDDGTSSSKPNPFHYYSNPGYYTVRLAVRDTIKGCSDTHYELIQVGSVECKALFEYEVDVDSLEVKFTNTSKGQLTNYYWNFGDYSSSNEQNPVKRFEKPGLYPVTLSVNNSAGDCADIFSAKIQVGEVKCDAAFDVFVDSTTNVAYFENKSLGNASKLKWHFGDGFESTRENPVHFYTNPGYFTVRLITANDDQSCMDKAEETLLIGAQGLDCEADFFFAVDENTQEVRFTDNSLGDGLTYFWDFDDGDSALQANPVHKYVDGGYFNVCLTVENPSGISNTTCKSIRVAPRVQDDCFTDFIFSVDSTTRTVTFMDESAGNPNRWIWNFGDGSPTSTDQNPQHTYAEAGYYKVKLISGNTESRCASLAFDMVNVAEEANGFVAGFGYQIDSLNLKSSGKPVDFVGIATTKTGNMKWDFDDGNFNTKSYTPTNVYYETNTYNVCFTISDPITEQSATFCDEISVELTTWADELFADDIEFIVYPNPFEDAVTIKYQLQKSTHVLLEVYDELGRKIDKLIDQEMYAGQHQLQWQNSNIRSGIYQLRMVTSDGVIKNTRVIKQ